MLGTTAKLSMLGVVVILEKNILRLRSNLTEMNINESREARKRCRDGMPISIQTREG